MKSLTGYDSLYAEIIVAVTNKNVDKIFHYGIPESLSKKIKTGSRVLVPFGKGGNNIEGYVVGFSENTDVPAEKIKHILEVLDEKRAFNEEMLLLARWMKTKYFSSMAECIRCVIPSGVLAKNDAGISKKIAFVRLNGDTEAVREAELRGSDIHKRIVALLREKKSVEASELKKSLKISDSPLKTLEKKGVVVIEYREVLRDALSGGFDDAKDSGAEPELTAQQETAVNHILNRRDAKPVLIHGVTGSGKTEIYMRLIKSCMDKGKQAIMLVPEISLTPQTVSVFYSRFGDKVTVTHSRLSAGERYDQWKKARDGAVSIMIGPRSAVFAPFDSLGVIIIDEEHENTYKSETAPKYSAKEVALERAKNTGALVVFGSATPSLETYYEARLNHYDLITLDERINKRLPDIFIIDMRTELEEGNRSVFSRRLSEAMADRLAKGEQIILFLNRRGHSTFVSCRKCGYVMKCKNCSVNYTYHAYNGKLCCHYCGDSAESPDNCPACGSKYIRFFGVGTQKLEEETRKLFPDAGILRMDMDTTAGKHGHEKILGKFRRGEASILLGTQMIAKGLDFPKVSLVGVVAADLSLNNGDFRAGETTFQLLTQVAGRAGRAETSGSVYIQTYNPEHYSIVYAQDGNYEEFYRHELALRRQMMYPPFTKVFSILFTGADERELIVNLYKLHDIMVRYNKKESFGILGPAPAIVSKMNNVFRWKLFVKAEDEERLKNFVIFCMEKLRAGAELKNINIHLTLNPAVMV